MNKTVDDKKKEYRAVLKMDLIHKYKQLQRHQLSTATPIVRPCDRAVRKYNHSLFIFYMSELWQIVTNMSLLRMKCINENILGN